MSPSSPHSSSKYSSCEKEPDVFGRRYKPAGGKYVSIDAVRNLNSGNCNEELQVYIANVNGRIPIFGYPMVSYSPPNSGLNLNDKKVWR